MVGPAAALAVAGKAAAKKVAVVASQVMMRGFSASLSVMARSLAKMGATVSEAAAKYVGQAAQMKLFSTRLSQLFSEQGLGSLGDVARMLKSGKASEGLVQAVKAAMLEASRGLGQVEGFVKLTVEKGDAKTLGQMLSELDSLAKERFTVSPREVARGLSAAAARGAARGFASFSADAIREAVKTMAYLLGANAYAVLSASGGYDGLSTVMQMSITSSMYERSIDEKVRAAAGGADREAAERALSLLLARAQQRAEA